MSDLVFWLTPWEPSFILASLFAAAVVQYGVNAKAPLWRQLCFWSGLSLLYIGLHTGVDYYGEHMFFVHRLQHLALHHLAPILIALSRPGDVFKGLRDMQNRLTVLNHPVGAPLLFSTIFVLWLVPSVHTIAMLDDRVYRLMNYSVALNGLMFWSAVLNGKASAPVRIAMVVATMPVQIIMGLMLVTASYDLYPLYELCGRAWSIAALDDQKLGGLILWLPGVMMNTIVIAIIGARMVFATRPAGSPAE